MRVALIHQYYLRPGQGGGSRFNEMARAWAQQGHEVWVIAGQVAYTSGEKPEALRGRLGVREDDGEVRVWRVYTPNTYNATFAGRALALTGFGLSAAVAVAMLPPCDVIIATSPPLTVALAGVLARMARGWPLVFEVRDLWPESAVATGVLSASSPITRALQTLEALANRCASHTVALTPAIAQSTIRRGLQRVEDVTVIPNGAGAMMLDRPADPVARAALRERLGWTHKFVVLYAGAHGLANHLEQYIEAAKRLEHLPHIHLAAIGDGPRKPALMRAASDAGLTNMSWLEPVGRERIVDIFDAADCGAAILKKTPTFETVYPNKIFDSMARAKPVLCVVDGVARELVEQAGAGVFAEPEQPGVLAHVIASLAADPERARELGECGQRLVRERFDRRVLATQYLDLLQRLATSK